MSGMKAIDGSWVDLGQTTRDDDFEAYVQRISEARFVLRRVSRILDEAARHEGLDPLQHQALIQISGVQDGATPIRQLAERLDVVPAHASRLVKQLDQLGLVQRADSAEDRRVSLVSASDAGVEKLRAIDREVHHQMAYFQHGLNATQRVRAMAIFAFYVGEPGDSPVGLALRSAAEAASAAS